MRLTTGAFAAMTAELRLVAEEHCEGRIAAITEGGYDLRALADCLRSVVTVLGADKAEPAQWPASRDVAPTRGHAAVASAKAALARYWKL
jgi:acetoin utilization deacetylase AcuC-like enzyme